MSMNDLFGLGHAYLRVPRSIIINMMNEDPQIRRIYRLYFTLLGTCNYSPGVVSLNGYQYDCKVGELFTSYRKLAGKTGYSKNSIACLLEQLREEGRITFATVDGGIRLQVLHYEDITRNFIHTNSSPTPPEDKTDDKEDPEVTRQRKQQQKEQEEAFRKMLDMYG